MKLLIAIPALNEEDSIEKIIQRCLAAKGTITEQSAVDEVEITVVSDGSTDDTCTLAQQFVPDITVIEFENNRGYGAAIKEAWAKSDADLLGFLDADGTCDPEFFANLCNLIEKESADVVLGCRMNAQSRMPFIRRIGNRLFAMMLTYFSSSRIRDTASGMRVVRRSSLGKLMPLPDGLHFTPAMSARAILSDDIRICEIDMPYEEREGESKLKVGKDGLRFLAVIVSTALLYRPSRPLSLMGYICLVIAAGLMIMPTLFYLQNRFVLEWMIYRFIVANLLGVSGFLLICVSYLSTKIVQMSLPTQRKYGRSYRLVSWLLSIRQFWLLPLALFLCGGLLVLPSLWELVRTGATYEHWSRFIAMSFFYMVAVILIITRILDYILDLIIDRIAYLAKSDL